MNILRKTIVALAGTFLVPLLFSFGFAWSVHQVFGNSTDIKQALRSSGLYTSVVGEALDQSQRQQHSNTSSSDVPVGDPHIRAAIQSAFPPSYLQSQTENTIDATYAWIQGKTPTLQFRIDMSGAKAKLADGVGQYAQARVASLPRCAATTTPSGDIDPFTATCVPKGVDDAAIASASRNNILQGDFLKDSTITADTIKTKDGITLNQQLKNVPKAYQRSVSGLYISGVITLCLLVAVACLSIDWRHGVRRAGIFMVVMGAFSAASAWLASFIVHKVAVKVAEKQTADTPLQTQILHVVQTLTNNVRTWWMAYSITLLVAGTVAILISVLVKPRLDQSQEVNLPSGVDGIEGLPQENLPAAVPSKTAHPRRPQK